MNKLVPVDHSALRFNQALIIFLSVVGYIANSIWLVSMVGLIMLLGSLVGRPGFWFLYKGIAINLGWIKQEVIADHPQPHRFAQMLGGLFLVGSGVAFLFGWIFLAWVLCWVVIFLASLNLFAGFCVGCFVYYWLNRTGIPGFSKSPPPNTFPGMRPRVR